MEFRFTEKLSSMSCKKQESKPGNSAHTHSLYQNMYYSSNPTSITATVQDRSCMQSNYELFNVFFFLDLENNLCSV